MLILLSYHLLLLFHFLLATPIFVIGQAPITVTLTLGARGHLPSGYIVSSLWVLKQFVQSLPSRYVVSSFKKYPLKYPLGTFWMKPLSSFEKNLPNYPAGTFEQMLQVLSKSTQPYTWQVLWEFVVKLDHTESSLWVFWTEPARYILIKLMGIFSKNSEHLFKKYPLGNLVSSFQTNSGVSFKKYPVGTSVGTF